MLVLEASALYAGVLRGKCLFSRLVVFVFLFWALCCVYLCCYSVVLFFSGAEF